MRHIMASLCVSALVSLAATASPDVPIILAAIDSNRLSERCVLNAEQVISNASRLEASTTIVLEAQNGIEFTNKDHAQGVQRVDRDNRSYLFVTQNLDNAIPSRLVIAEISSGDRLSGTLGADERASTIDVSSVFTGGSFAQYMHPGGLAVHGNTLAVGLELPFEKETMPKGAVDFYDVSSPLDPKFLLSLPLASKAAGVGLTRLPSGHYLLVIADNAPKRVEFFRSKTSARVSRDTEFEFVREFQTGPLDAGDVKYFQNVHLLSDCETEQVYMTLAFQDPILGVANSGLGKKDRLTRYQVLNPEAGLELKPYGRQEVGCNDDCDLGAGFGPYIGENGDLSYYATTKSSPLKITEFKVVPSDE